MFEFSNDEFIAHVRKSDGAIQTVARHLQDVSKLSKKLASKINLPTAGLLIGLSHDLGKYSNEFQRYIRGATGSDQEEQERSRSLKGQVDHATAGAQKIWNTLSNNNGIALFARQVLATCVAYHHGKLPDYIDQKAASPFLKRMNKSNLESYVEESLENGDPEIIEQLQAILSGNAVFDEFKPVLHQICELEKNDKLRRFHFGLLTRFLFSCLLDADRLDTANFEYPNAATLRNTDTLTDWKSLVNALESYLKKYEAKNQVDIQRSIVSNECLAAASRPKGIFTLSVPTGGGKTLASLRFALHHALHHSTSISGKGFDRVIFVIPYTSIIEQNAGTVRSILGDNVIEHHSNLVPEKDSWRNRVLSENWDAPIVFTTSVQLLNTLFAGSTRNARRMNQLANAIIIFDEIQTLPIKTVHLFNNSINFLLQTCGSTVVFCTATQPLLDRVNPELGAIRLNSNSKIIADDRQLFKELSRTQIKDYCKSDGWMVDEVAELAVNQMIENGSVLAIVNTKSSALALYKKLHAITDAKVFHLSTSMCPAHRKTVLDEIRACLDPICKQSIICVSTQLIEAGVDVDFGSVIRYLAGLDSIAQAAGRCNRNGRRAEGLAPVFILNAAEENVDKLIDIKKGQEITRRILNEFRNDPASLDNDLLSTKAMERFYEYYFFDRSEEMSYSIYAKKSPKIDCDTTLLDLFSSNTFFIKDYQRSTKSNPPLFLHQAFSTAADEFCVIDAPTDGIIVPYGDKGKELIVNLAAAFLNSDSPIEKQGALLRSAQQYSVNVFPNELERLNKEGCIHEVQKGTGIYHLNERHYSDVFGVSVEEVMTMTFLNV